MLLEGLSCFLFLKCDLNVTQLGLLLFSTRLKKEVLRGNEPYYFIVDKYDAIFPKFRIFVENEFWI